MSILSRLWRYVHTNGYPLPNSSAFAPPEAPARRTRGRGRSSAARLEYMEQRLLMTTLVAGESFTYTDARNNKILAQVNGSSTVAELIAATQDGDGTLLFGDIEGSLGNGTVLGNGAVPVTGQGQGSAQLGIFATAQLNVGGIASNQAGNTYGFNIFNVDAAGQPLTTFPITGHSTTIKIVTNTLNSDGTVTSTTTTTTAPAPWDIQYFQINNATGAGENPVDLFEVLEGVDGGAQVQAPVPAGSPPGTSGVVTQTPGLEPGLVGATKVKIGGAAFDPLNGLLYFDVEYTPKAGGGGGTPVQQDILYSIDPTAPNNNIAYFPGSLVPIPGTSTVTRIGALDNGGGAYNISALAFRTNGASNATLFTYRVPGTGTNAGGPPPEPNLETYNANGVGGPILVPVNDAQVTNGFHPGAATPTFLTGVTGLAALPATIPGANGDFIYAVAVNAGTTQLVRIDLDGIDNSTAFNLRTITSTNFGSATDQLETPPANINGVAPFDGNALVGLTFNPKIVDPFNGNLGVLMSYDNAPPTPLVVTQDTVFVNDRLRITQGDVFAVYTNQADIADSITFQHVTINPNTNVITSDAYAGELWQPEHGQLAKLHHGHRSHVRRRLPGFPRHNAQSRQSDEPDPQPTVSLRTNRDQHRHLAGGGYHGFGRHAGRHAFAGLTVGYGLEQTIDPTRALLDQTLNQGLGENFTSANGLAISQRPGRGHQHHGFCGGSICVRR